MLMIIALAMGIICFIVLWVTIRKDSKHAD